MANEPNNADEQLKQYAAERRQMAPKEIHPVTRNILQGEVRRTYGNPEEERRARLRVRWLQALAWLVMAAAIPLIFLPRNPKESFEQARPTKPGEVTLPTKQRGEAPIELSDTKVPVAPVKTEPPSKDVVVTPVSKGAAVAESKTTAPSAPLRDEAAVEVTTRSAKTQIDGRRQIPATEALAGAAAPAPAPTVAPASAANNSRLNFANTISNQQILNRFRLEQNGERLKFVEADGSTYSGRVFSQQGGADNFQAAGVNRTLNKSLLLTGQVMRATLAQQQANVSNLQNNVANNSAANNSQYLNNSSDEVRIQGQATIGNTQYKVDAQVTPGP